MLHEDEKELGVALVDIGGGTTDLAIFTDGAIVHTSVLAVGGHQLTADIAYGLRTPHSEAERIKHKHGCAMVADGRRRRDDGGAVGRRAPGALGQAPDRCAR